MASHMDDDKESCEVQRRAITMTSSPIWLLGLACRIKGACDQVSGQMIQ